MIIHGDTSLTGPTVLGPNGLVYFAVVAVSFVPELVEVVQFLRIVDFVFFSSRRSERSDRH